MGQEYRFSKKVHELVKKNKHIFFGFRMETSHTMPGLPDWVFVFPKGRVVFLELKVKGGKLTPAQVVVHKILKKLQIPVYILTKYTNSVRVNNIEFKTLEEAVNKIVEDHQPDEFSSDKINLPRPEDSTDDSEPIKWGTY